jgi:hypothetical protein
MKKILIILAIFTVSDTLVLAQTAKHAKGLHHWVLNINPDTKKSYLDSVVSAWKKDTIDLKFSALKYDAEGKLAKFKGSVEIRRREDHASGTFDNDEYTSVRVEVDDGPGVDITGK